MSLLHTAVLAPFGRLLVVLLPASLVGFVVDGVEGAWAGAALVLLAAFAYYAWKLAQLMRWLESPDQPVPDGAGLWGEVLSRLHRFMRRERETREQLAMTLQRFQLAAEAVPDGAVMLDADNRILWCNATAARDLSINTGQDRGGLVTNLVRQPAFVEALQHQAYKEPFLIKGQGGPDQSLSVVIVPFGTDQKLVLARDVTQLERIDTMRRDFIANVSHELRTPLTVLAGFVETLERANDGSNPVMNKALGHMESQSRRMQLLVDDLLTLSRLEDSRNMLTEQAVNLPEMAQALVSDAQQLSNGQHRISLQTTERWVRGNREELRSALGNLVTNAVRYTPPGGEILVTLEMVGNELAFRVRDTGEGIAAEHIPRLTERFYRVDRGRSRASGGTGLGLAIVKHVLNRHQARLDIESEVGRGSTFSVVFPAQRSVAPGTDLTAA